jgi:putative ABC transport system permease protein
MAEMLHRRSWRELSHRKARSFFTIATIAAAVTGLWLFAIPLLVDEAMNDRVESDLLWDLRLSPNGIVLDAGHIAAIHELPNVAGVEARLTVGADLAADGREMSARLVSVDDFIDQEVNAVRLSEGEWPVAGEILTDPQNARTGRYMGGVGDRVTLGGFPVTVAGVAASLEFSAVVDDGDPVFYLPLQPLQEAVGGGIVNWIDVRVHDHDPAVVQVTADEIRTVLVEADPAVTYWNVLEVREPGEWPEKESFDNVIRLTYVVAALGLASALLMVSTTMNTIVSEQTKEIGIVKAIGGGRRAIVRSYLFTAAILGGVGTIVPLGVLAISVLVGLGGTMLATLPAIRRATDMSVRTALGNHGVATSVGRGVGLGPRRFPESLRIGIRNAMRRAGRSLSTAIQVGFAVGMFLGFLALGITVMEVSESTFDGAGGDIWVAGPTGVADDLSDVPGVADVVPVFYADAGIGSETYELQGQTPAAEAFHDEMGAGRWFTDDEETGAADVTVIGLGVAKATGATVGDVLVVETATGSTPLEVVGVDSLMVSNGKVLYTPLATAIDLGGGGSPNNYFVLTSSADEAFIDGVATNVRGTLEGQGLSPHVETRYIEKRAELSQNRTILAMIMIVGVPVIAIGMLGLVNTMTMNIIERTREIGILRSIGARARHVRRIIRSEALVLAVVGWVIAIPLGYGIGLFLVRLLSDGFGVDLAMSFPWWPIPVALIATLLTTAIVVRIPTRRATRLQPGVALRYE